MSTKPRTLPALALAALALITAGAGCGSGGSASTPSVPTQFRAARLAPGAFVRAIIKPNSWLPLVAGTQWVREGTTDVGHRRLPHPGRQHGH